MDLLLEHINTSLINQPNFDDFNKPNIYFVDAVESIATYFIEEYIYPLISILKTRWHIINRHSDNINKH